MPRQLKVQAIIVFVLAVLFGLFFQICKHNPALATVNAFADDPSDAVGSFAVQLTMFIALLSLVRAFRPYQPNKEIDGQKLLLLRGEYIAVWSIAVTLVSDIVAMIRHSSLWLGLPAGQILAMLVGGMTLLTLLTGWLLSRSARNIALPPVKNAWTRAIVLLIVGTLTLAIYPENWRQSILGELFTVVVGAVILFVVVWAFGVALVPYRQTPLEDLVDDLTSMYRWLKAHTGRLMVFFRLCEKVRDVSVVDLIVGWLNPRRHAWNISILVGILMGVALFLAEAVGEGSSPQLNRFILVAAVFIGLESVAVLLGYGLLRQPLGLFRQESEI